MPSQVVDSSRRWHSCFCRTLGLAVVALAAPVTTSAGAADLPRLLERTAAQHAAGDAAGALATLREALHAAWLDAPLGIVKAVLVEDSDNMYGQYEPRGNNRYAAGETIVIYVEPVGYDYLQEGGLWRLGFAGDMLVLDRAGNVLAGKEGAMRVELTNHNPVKEFVLSVTYTLTGASPGTYVLRTTLRDLHGDGQVKFENEVEIVPAGSG